MEKQRPFLKGKIGLPGVVFHVRRFSNFRGKDKEIWGVVYGDQEIDSHLVYSVYAR